MLCKLSWRLWQILLLLFAKKVCYNRNTPVLAPNRHLPESRAKVANHEVYCSPTSQLSSAVRAAAFMRVPVTTVCSTIYLASKRSCSHVLYSITEIENTFLNTRKRSVMKLVMVKISRNPKQKLGFSVTTETNPVHTYVCLLNVVKNYQNDSTFATC